MSSKEQEGYAFGKQNYLLLIAGFVIVLIGFLLLVGGGSDDPTVFSDAIFNTQRWTVAPVTILAGYIIVIFAIMRKPKKADPES